MDKNYIITIVDSHVSQGEKGGSEFTSVGSFQWEENGDYRLSYRETDPSMGGAVTTIAVSDNAARIEMTRSGPFGTQLIMEKNRRHVCLYHTPYGELNLGIYTGFIKSVMGPAGGTLRFCYTLDFSTGLASENELTVTVKEEK